MTIGAAVRSSMLVRSDNDQRDFAAAFAEVDRLFESGCRTVSFRGPHGNTSYCAIFDYIAGKAKDGMRCLYLTTYDTPACRDFLDLGVTAGSLDEGAALTVSTYKAAEHAKTDIDKFDLVVFENPAATMTPAYRARVAAIRTAFPSAKAIDLYNRQGLRGSLHCDAEVTPGEPVAVPYRMR